jgi:hypothetical protein
LPRISPPPALTMTAILDGGDCLAEGMPTSAEVPAVPWGDSAVTHGLIARYRLGKAQ